MGLSVRRAGHLVIRCRDAEATARFFRDVVGFRPFGRVRRGMHFLTADFTHNHHMLLVRPAKEGAPAPEPDRRIGLARVAFELRSRAALAALQARLRAAGTRATPGEDGMSLAFRDPDGTLFEFYCRPQEEARRAAPGAAAMAGGTP